MKKEKKVFDLTHMSLDEILAFVRGKRALEEGIKEQKTVEKFITKEYYDYSKGEYAEFEVKA